MQSAPQNAADEGGYDRKMRLDHIKNSNSESFFPDDAISKILKILQHHCLSFGK